jgi:FdrA protein
VTERVLVRRGAYYDSVTLMLVSSTAAGEDGAHDVAVGMGTPLNLELLADQGFAVEAGPNDLVIAVRARDDAAADAVVVAVDREPAGGAAAERPPAVSLRAAARRDPELSLAFLSIPGRHVAYEAAEALEAGLHVFCFSDGVDLATEAALKRRAIERGLLFMGADCGTAIVDGVAFGFANAVERGPVGIVGASGTGIQEVCCLLDAAGVGISHAIGVGGRDLQAEVGGLMMRRGLELLAGDPDTRAIVAISKPPDPAVAATIEEAAGAAGKPVILAFVGDGPPAAGRRGGGDGPPRAGERRGGGDGPPGAERRGGLPGAGAVERAGTLEAAAAWAARLVGGALPVFEARLRRPPAAGLVRGLYSGGTLCGEAAVIVGHGEFVDFGADEYTQGRAHPMIDPWLRLEHLARAARDPEVAVLLLDVVLGYGAHPDPATALAPAIVDADKHVIVALCGAAGDPQGLDRQRHGLEQAGAVVTRSNAHAARLAREASRE